MSAAMPESMLKNIIEFVNKKIRDVKMKKRKMLDTLYLRYTPENRYDRLIGSPIEVPSERELIKDIEALKKVALVTVYTDPYSEKYIEVVLQDDFLKEEDVKVIKSFGEIKKYTDKSLDIENINNLEHNQRMAKEHHDLWLSSFDLAIRLLEKLDLDTVNKYARTHISSNKKIMDIIELIDASIQYKATYVEDGVKKTVRLGVTTIDNYTPILDYFRF